MIESDGNGLREEHGPIRKEDYFSHALAADIGDIVEKNGRLEGSDLSLAMQEHVLQAYSLAHYLRSWSVTGPFPVEGPFLERETPFARGYMRFRNALESGYRCLMLRLDAQLLFRPYRNDPLRKHLTIYHCGSERRAFDIVAATDQIAEAIGAAYLVRYARGDQQGSFTGKDGASHAFRTTDVEEAGFPFFEAWSLSSLLAVDRGFLPGA